MRTLNRLKHMTFFLLGTTVACSAVHKAIKLDTKLMKGSVKFFAFFTVLKKQRPARDLTKEQYKFLLQDIHQFLRLILVRLEAKELGWNLRISKLNLL